MPGGPPALKEEVAVQMPRLEPRQKDRVACILYTY